MALALLKIKGFFNLWSITRRSSYLSGLVMVYQLFCIAPYYKDAHIVYRSKSLHLTRYAGVQITAWVAINQGSWPLIASVDLAANEYQPSGLGGALGQTDVPSRGSDNS